MKALFKAVFFCIKWAVIIALGVELLSFAVVAGSNLVLYGKLREGSVVFYDPYTIYLNIEGQKPTSSPPEKLVPREHVVWMFGGSTMRGATEDPSKTIASVLSDQLNKDLDDRKIVVENFGENSFTSLLEVKYLQKQLIENSKKPDTIVFYDGANESSYFAQYRDVYAHHGIRRLRGLIESYFKSFFGMFKALNAAVRASFTKELYDKVMLVQVKVEPNSPQLNEFVDKTLQRYDYVQRTAECYGADFYLFWQPAYWIESSPVADDVQEKEKNLLIHADSFAATKWNFQTVNQALYDKLKVRPYFHDLRNVLTARGDTTYKPDGVHLNDRGRSMVGDAMAQVMTPRLRQ